MTDLWFEEMSPSEAPTRSDTTHQLLRKTGLYTPLDHQQELTQCLDTGNHPLTTGRSIGYSHRRKRSCQKYCLAFLLCFLHAVLHLYQKTRAWSTHTPWAHDDLPAFVRWTLLPLLSLFSPTPSKRGVSLIQPSFQSPTATYRSGGINHEERKKAKKIRKHGWAGYARPTIRRNSSSVPCGKSKLELPLA